MDWYYYIIFIFVFLFLLWLYMGLQIAISIVRPYIKSLEETASEETQRDPSLIPYLSEHKTSEYDIKSASNYKIRIYEMIEYENGHKFVVISHGYTYSHHGSIKYAKMMIELGFNVILYDQRFHGKSGGINTTLAYHEHKDLKVVISHIFNQYGQDIYLGTYGESMGSATCLLEQRIDNRVKFVVSDSGFKDLALLVKSRIKKKKLSPFIFFRLVNVFVWIISRGSLVKVSPINAIKKTRIPILFVHGEQDDFIHFSHTLDMYNAYEGDKLLFLAKKQALHARSYYYNKKEYFRILKEFNKKYLQD